MTKTLYLHVGGPKTGTTYVQQVLEHNRGTLAEAGVLVVGPRLDLIHSAMVIREDPRLKTLPARASQAWERVVEQVTGWEGDTAVASYELFANAPAQGVRRALAAFSGIEVHVVVSARDLGGAISSAWQEQLKFGSTTPLEEWVPPAESAERSEWGWRTMQPANVAARWGADLPADRVHVVTVPSSAASSTTLWERFAQACGLPGADMLDLDIERANESLGVVEAELLRRINVGLAGRIDGGRQKSLWIRDTLAHRVLAPIGREKIALTEAQQDEASAEAEKAIEAITEAGYPVHGSLDDLRPKRAAGRRPSEVAEGELVESATLALGDLLVWTRDQGAEPASGPQTPGRRAAAPQAPPIPEGVAARARYVARAGIVRAAAGTKNRQVRALEKRIAELEQQVHESRQLHLRVASLQDLVAQLLLPAAQQDQGVTSAMLRDYRARSL